MANAWTLTKVKERTGDETPNFEATLCLDGRAVARVENHGTGGQCMWRWLDATAEAAFTAHAKEAMPCEDFEIEDAMIYRMLDERTMRRAFDRLIRSAVLYTVQGKRGIYRVTMRGRSVADVLPAVEARRAAWRVDQILNALPVEDAWALYVAQVDRLADAG